MLVKEALFFIVLCYQFCFYTKFPPDTAVSIGGGKSTNYILNGENTTITVAMGKGFHFYSNGFYRKCCYFRFLMKN